VPSSTEVQNPFVGLLLKYQDDPVLFVREVLGGNPDANQELILTAMARDPRRQVAVRSGHKVGKTWTAAWLIIWHACTRYPQKTICTSSTEKQLFEALAAETKVWFRKLPQAWRDLWDIKAESIELKSEPDASFVSFRTAKPENSEAFGGIHSDGSVLLICDEASGIPPEIYEALSGSMSSFNARMLLTGNPVRTTGLFFDVFRKLKALWWTYHISCVGHPRIDPQWVENKRQEYGGEDDNRFRVRVLGEFPKADNDTIIPFELAEAALTRDVTPNPEAPEIWGVDCGRGGDPSAIAKRKGNVLREKTKIFASRDTMLVAGWVKQQYDDLLPSDRPAEINIDVIGIGAGVVDRLTELGLPVRGVNVSEEASNDKKYHKLRSELWYKAEAWYRKLDCNIANDEELMEEHVAQKGKIYDSNGKDYALSKEEMKSRYKVRSPNRADAFNLTLASDHITMAQGTSGSQSWKTAIKRGLRFI
jgi:phage terminase large subunit